MSDGVLCSARPADLLEYTRETGDVIWQLRNGLVTFDAAVEEYLSASGGWLIGLIKKLGYRDPLWNAVVDLDDLSSWVSHVAWAFAMAGAGGDIHSTDLVSTSTLAVGSWLDPVEWKPAAHVRPGQPGDWLRAFNPLCRGYQDGAGYRGSGFIQGPDGRLYPLVAPFVTRDGTEYNADNGLAPGQTSVLELDGSDQGWTTVWESIGVERWREDPGVWDKVWMGVGSTVGGRPSGSAESDVEKLVLMPGMAPWFGAPADRPPEEPTPPPYMVPAAPDYAPPGQPDTMYPGSVAGAAVSGGVPMLIEGFGGGLMADLGSFDAFDVTFQENAAGDVRALYKRVYVGFDDAGEPYADSVWVTGPENNDHVLINYAP
ncbi:MAG: hypothetical protein QOI95_966 [Acidimicrobiaceae bacterium]|jgi:hypothetical protein